MTTCAWPAVTRDHKPWTRWWWMGSAVDEENLTRELAELRDAGFGGVEITPIYGVQGAEDRDVPFLSDRWLALVRHACREAARLGLGVDVVPGSGWRLGGPQVPQSHRAVKLELRCRQTPLGRRLVPVALPSGENVKRPGPGGAGFSIDMFDARAVRRHLARFNARFFAQVPADLVRAQFHDSWEYEADWSRALLKEFARRRGYDLRNHADALAAEASGPQHETVARVLHDYRLTVEEMVLDNFCGTWRELCRQRGVLTRNQAHGAPGNILDIYAQSDIPETEMIWDGVNPLVQKFASSAGHVAGKRLISAESFTWLSNHWQSDLAKIKRYADHLFLCGINHLVCHGTAYSPSDAAWPGWLFYAAIQLNARNPIWRDWPAVAAYIARCQSFLQAGTPNNSVLVYWPLPDLAMQPGGRLQRYGIRSDAWVYGAALRGTAASLWDQGVLFDYVSDRQLQQAAVADGAARMPGGAYRAVVLPPLCHIPPETVCALVRLAAAGVQVIASGTPTAWDVPGLPALAARRRALQRASQALVRQPGFLVSDAPAARLADIAACVEPMQQGTGLRCVRRRLDSGNVLYFIANRSDRTFDGRVKPSVRGAHAILRDPWTGATGTARITERGLRLQLEPQQSILVEIPSAVPSGPRWRYLRQRSRTIAELRGPWTIACIAGGPRRPGPIRCATLGSLTALGVPDLQRFAGTVRYETSFDLSDVPPDGVTLDLGDVRHSARVFLDGHALGVAIQVPYRFHFDGRRLKRGANRLVVEVTTLGANRIRDLDRRGVRWKIFRDINVVDDRYQPFDASQWPLQPAGLIGPVRLERCSIR